MDVAVADSADDSLESPSGLVLGMAEGDATKRNSRKLFLLKMEVEVDKYSEGVVEEEN